MKWFVPRSRSLTAVACLGLAVSSTSFGPVAQGASEIESSAALYQNVMSQLDANGQLMFYINIDGVLRKVLKEADGFIQLASKGDPDAKKALDVIARLDQFFGETGLYDLRAFGMSSVPLGGGQYVTKAFVGRTPSANAPLFWQIGGGEPHDLRGLYLFPRDAVVASVSDMNLQALWTLIQKGVLDVGGEKPHEAFRAKLDELKQSMQVDVDALIQSLGNEMAISIQFAGERTIELPLGPEPVTMPEPSAFFAVATKDDTLLKTILSIKEQMQLPLEKQEADGLTIYVMPAAEQAPFPVQMALAQQEGFFFVASNPGTIKAALDSLKKKNGLAASVEFRGMAAKLPAKYNDMTYVDARFNRVVQDIQIKATKSTGGADADMQVALLEKIYGWSGQGTAMTVHVNKPDGVLSQGISPTSGKQMAMAMMAAPVGLVAAIAIPSIFKARTTAQQNQGLNSLRMIDSAKEQWALANSKQDGDEVTEADLLEYFMGGTMPTPPPGGRFEINPIGTDPVLILANGTVVTLNGMGISQPEEVEEEEMEDGEVDEDEVEVEDAQP